MMPSLLVLSTLFGSCIALPGVGKTQSVAVTGRLECRGEPAADVKVKLYEKENLLDVKMAEGQTDEDGEFQLSGSKSEISTIDPKVNIYHKCNYEGPCFRKFGITIPDNNITEGEIPKKVYDLGTIKLENRVTGETTDCLN